MKSNRLVWGALILSLGIIFAAAKGGSLKSKVGHINTNELWNAMPEKAAADSALLKIRNEFITYLTQRQKTFEEGVVQFTKDSATMSDLIKKEKLDGLLKEQETLKAFPEQADAELQAKREELYTPIRTEMQTAIDETAKEKGYDYVMDSAFGSILYAHNAEDNILAAVKTKLSIK